jgi:hypothetical protein
VNLNLTAVCPQKTFLDHLFFEDVRKNQFTTFLGKNSAPEIKIWPGPPEFL